MKKYENLFEGMEENELCSLYEQYIKWQSDGFIADESKELSRIRDEYHELFESQTLVMVELDLLKAIAKKWKKENGGNITEHNEHAFSVRYMNGIIDVGKRDGKIHILVPEDCTDAILTKRHAKDLVKAITECIKA